MNQYNKSIHQFLLFYFQLFLVQASPSMLEPTEVISKNRLELKTVIELNNPNTEIKFNASSLQENLNRSERSTPYLIFPMSYAQIGPAHTSSGKGYGTMSAIDMAKNLYSRWLSYEPRYGNEVYAAHAGYVYHDSWTWQCGLTIKHWSGFETHYLHITDLIDETDWTWGSNFGGRRYVRQGQRIGRVSMTKSNSNCYDACASFNEDCSSGPHLHFEIKRRGVPQTLNNVRIGGYTIRKLSRSANYDKGCGSNLLNCATIFSKHNRNYYPVYGGNIGGGYSFPGNYWQIPKFPLPWGR